MEDLIRAIVRAGDLDSIQVEFFAHSEPGQQQWRVTGWRKVKGAAERYTKFGAVNDDLRNALIALASTVGENR